MEYSKDQIPFLDNFDNKKRKQYLDGPLSKTLKHI